MSSSALLAFRSLSAHQQQLIELTAGTELRCVEGSVDVHLGYTGLSITLTAHQSIRIPQSQWASVSSEAASRISLSATPDECVQAEKNRQGLGGLWRLLAARLMVRRGPRAA